MPITNGFESVSPRTPMLIVGSRRFYERAFSNMLNDLFELFYFDQQGFIENTHLKESAYENLDQIVAEIETFRIANSLERFILFGHSGHAYMALEYSKAYSDHLLGLVLCGCSPDLSNSTHQAALDYFEELADLVRKEIFLDDMSRLEDRIKAEPDLRFIHFVLCQRAKNWYDPEYDAAWLWEGIATHLPTLDYVWGKLFAAYSPKNNLEKIDCPVLFLQGKFDFVAGPASLWDPYLPYFKNQETKHFLYSAHYPMLDEPRRFRQMLLEWFININQ